MATTKLSLWNAALRLLGERALTSVTEEGESRRALDAVYDDGLLYCLAQGYWNFAIRTIEIYADTDLEPAFGLQYAFGKPNDWVRTFTVSASETFFEPYLRYTDETDFWYSDIEPLYIRYVSKDSEVGLDLSRWPATFAKAVEAYLALEIAPLLTGTRTTRAEVEAIWHRRIVDARSKDAMNEPPGFPPPGTWVKSRRSSFGFSRRER